MKESQSVSHFIGGYVPLYNQLPSQIILRSRKMTETRCLGGATGELAGEMVFEVMK